LVAQASFSPRATVSKRRAEVSGGNEKFFCFYTRPIFGLYFLLCFLGFIAFIYIFIVFLKFLKIGRSSNFEEF